MSGPVRVHLLRHGAPDQPGRLLGRTDAGVTAAGIAACRMAALEVGDVALHSSDLVRALDCARAIGGARPVAIDPRWRELDFGAWDGRLPGACDREALDRFHADPDACPLDGRPPAAQDSGKNNIDYMCGSAMLPAWWSMRRS